MSSKISYLLFVFILCIFVIKSIKPQKCFMETSTIICRNITLNVIIKSIEVDVSQEYIHNLSIKNSIVNLVQRKTFKNYNNLKVLSICNSQLMFIEEHAFYDLEYLEKLDLSDNFLRRLSTNWFSMKNKITTLIFSNNLMEDLDVFDITYFPHLKLLNLSNNLLEYLPTNILNITNKDLILVLDKNPFNCRHIKWQEYLANRPQIQFCNETNLGNTAKLKLQPIVLPSADEGQNKTIPKDYCIKHCHFFNCVVWTFSGVWIGIILGNLGKIRDLIFLKRKKVENKSTQYDYLKFKIDKELLPTPIKQCVVDIDLQEAPKALNQ